MRKSNKLQCVGPESEVRESTKLMKDEAFKKAKTSIIAENRDRMKKDLEKYRSRTNTQIVVTALITTVSFTVGFTMPGDTIRVENQTKD